MDFRPYRSTMATDDLAWTFGLQWHTLESCQKKIAMVYCPSIYCIQGLMTNEDFFHFSKTSMFERSLPPFCWILLSNIHHVASTRLWDAFRHVGAFLAVTASFRNSGT
jgi:hypothetical protein